VCIQDFLPPSPEPLGDDLTMRTQLLRSKVSSRSPRTVGCARGVFSGFARCRREPRGLDLEARNFGHQRVAFDRIVDGGRAHQAHSHTRLAVLQTRKREAQRTTYLSREIERADPSHDASSACDASRAPNGCARGGGRARGHPGKCVALFEGGHEAKRVVFVQGIGKYRLHATAQAKNGGAQTAGHVHRFGWTGGQFGAGGTRCTNSDTRRLRARGAGARFKFCLRKQEGGERRCPTS
jgi:hypothetical protein